VAGWRGGGGAAHLQSVEHRMMPSGSSRKPRAATGTSTSAILRCSCAAQAVSLHPRCAHLSPPADPNVLADQRAAGLARQQQQQQLRPYSAVLRTLVQLPTCSYKRIQSRKRMRSHGRKLCPQRYECPM
jgi:hypothetical protein